MSMSWVIREDIYGLSVRIFMVYPFGYVIGYLFVWIVGWEFTSICIPGPVQCVLYFRIFS